MAVGMLPGMRDGGRPHGFSGFVEEIVLPGQYDTQQRWNAELRLRLAVLEDAVRLVKHGPTKTMRGRMLFDDAVRWFRRQEIREPFSLQAVCEAVGFDAGRVRERMEAVIAGHVTLPRLKRIQASRFPRVRTLERVALGKRKPGRPRKDRPLALVTT